MSSKYQSQSAHEFKQLITGYESSEDHGISLMDLIGMNATPETICEPTYEATQELIVDNTLNKTVADTIGVTGTDSSRISLHHLPDVLP